MVDTSSFYTAATSDIASIPTEWLIILIILLVWKFIWYGIALFKTIERKQITWFTVLFIATFLLGDLGLLAIIYL